MAKRFLSGLFGKKKSDQQEGNEPKISPTEISDVEAEVEEPLSSNPQVGSETNSNTDVETNAFETIKDMVENGDKDADAQEDHDQDEGSIASLNDEQGAHQDKDVDEQSPASEISPSPLSPPQLSASQENIEKGEKPKKGFFSRLKAGLSKTSGKLSDGVSSIFTKRKLDDEMLEELENLLISADLGVGAATRLTSQLAKTRYDKEITDEEVKIALSEEVSKTLQPFEKELVINTDHKPHVILMAGVNGAGKTTTIGKLASKFKAEGLSVMLAAGDTFRAAAIEQLTVWGERTNTPVIAREVGADAAGLAFDALKQAKADNIDVLMIDTAGRLQNRTELMDELAKVVRVIGKLDESAPHDTLLVLDATVGQNALSQVEVFKQVAGVSGLVMTKLDGTARGGVLVALADKFALPIHYIGVGEAIDDLQRFEADSFAKALAGIS